MTSKDDNAMPVIYGVSHVDGVTPVRIQFIAGTRLMKVDDTTTIQFDPSIVVTQNSTGYPLATGTLSTDDQTVVPWVVNATTGAVLIST